MTDEAKLGINNREFVEGMKAAAKASDELYAAVSKLSNQGGSSLDKLNRQGAAAAETVRNSFGPELGLALKNLGSNAENSANLFSESSRKIKSAHEASVTAMLAGNKEFTLDYINAWKNLGQAVPALLKPVYTGLVADQKAASDAAIGAMKDEAAAAKMLGDARRAEAKATAIAAIGAMKDEAAAAKMLGDANRAENARYQMWLKAAGEEQATREKLANDKRETWAKLNADARIAEEKRYQAWLKAGHEEQTAREKLQSEKVKAEIKQRNDWAQEQENKFQAVIKTARAQVDAANREREASYTSWWKTELGKRDALMDQQARKMAANSDNMKSQFIANEEAKTAAAKRAQLALESSAKSQVRGAVLNSSGAYSDINSGRIVFPRESATSFTGALRQMNATMRQSIVDGNDLHSAMRGLASGFNLLWLTWGNLLPLFTGAVISFGVKGVVEMGAKLDHTLQTIKVLSEESAGSMQLLQEQLYHIAESGPVGPLAVAEAMKTLALAGLSASEVSASIKDVLNFSVAGDVDLKKAADVMTTVATAFNVSTSAYNIVGDAISKTAAVSKSSVEDIGEAFKTASVLNKQYGASLTDVGVGLAALANLGIRGTAAGTALRNMYVDLSGRSKGATDALKALHLELRDGDGNFKNIITLTSDLNDALSKLNGKAQKNALKEMFSERGGKVIVELLDLLQQKATDTNSTVSSKLEELQQDIEDRAGFAIIAAAKLAMTPLNEMRSVVATMQTELIKTFDAISPAIYTVSENLKNMFKSAEFRNGIENLVVGFGKLALAVTGNIDKLVAFGAAVAVIKLTGFVHSIGTLAVTALTAFKMAAAAAATTNIALAGSFTTLGRAAAWLLPFVRIAGPIAAVTTAIVAMYEAFTFFSEVKEAVVDNATGAKHKAYLEKLREETERIREQTEALRENTSVEELRARKSLASGKQMSKEENAAATTAATSRLKVINDNITSFKKIYAETGSGKSVIEVLEADAAKTNAELARLATERLEIFKEEAAARRAAKELEWQQELEWQKKHKPSGTGNFQTAAELADAKHKANAEIQTEVAKFKELGKIYKDGETQAEKRYKEELRKLDSKHRNKLISEAEYQKSLADLATNTEDSITLSEKQASTQIGDAYEKLVTKIKNSPLDAAEKTKSLETLRITYDELKRAMTDNKADRAAERLLKLAEAADNAEGTVRKLKDSVEKFLVEDANHLASTAVEVGEAFDKYTAAGMEAAAREAEKYANKISEVLVEQEKLRAELGAITDPTQKARFEASLKQLDSLLEKLKARSEAAQSTAYKNAVDKLKAADFRKLTESIADAIIKGGVNAGPQIRAILEEEFLSKPFKVLIEAAISDVTTGGIDKLLSGGGATMGQLAKIGNTLSGVYDFVTSPTGWFSKNGVANGIASSAGSLGGNMSELGAWMDSDWLRSSGGWIEKNAGAMGEFAQSAGNALNYLSALQSADKGQWGRAVGQAVGTAYFGPLGGAIGGAIGGWVDDAFGGGHESSLGGGITGTFGANGSFTGQRFDRRRNSGQSGILGIGGTSAREWDNLSTLETGVQTALSVQFFMLKAQTAAFAESLGLSTTSITNYTRAMRLSLGSDSAANQKAVADFFTTMANEMASALVDSKYFKEGETAADALARLSTNLSSVNAAFGLMGRDKLGANMEGALTADSLITLFGSKDKFDSAQASFYNAFYSDAEKQANLKKSLEGSFAALGKTLPSTRDAFKQMVIAQDITTDSGKQTYAQLLSLSEAFDSLTNTAKKATESISETDFATQVAYLRFKGRLGLGGSVAGLQKVQGFATGGVHSGGWRVVGEDGAEIENTGPSRIYNHSDSLFDDSNIVAELQALRIELSYLRTEAKATASNTKKAANLYDKWDADGMPAVRT